MKKGQVTVFVIVALVVVFVIVLYFFADPPSLIGDSNDASVDDVKMFVDGCLEQAANDAVIEVALQGGYLTLPENSLNDNIPYYYDEDVLVPSKENVEGELARYVENSLFFCTHRFSDFNDFDVVGKFPEVSAEIFDDRVSFNVVYPVIVNKNNRTYYFEDFETEVFTRFGIVFDLASQIAFSYKEYDAFCFNCIYDLISEDDLYVKIFDYSDSSVFLIIDDSYELNGRPLEFYFSVREW